MHSTRRLLLVLAFTLGSIGCDQATKRLAEQHLRDTPGLSYLGGMVQLRHAENPGAFLSLGASMGHGLRFAFFTVVVGAVLLVLLGMALFSRKIQGLEIAALSAIAAGGISNWIDRVANDGRVIDFMYLQAGPLHTGVFNIADVLIMAGIPLVLLAGRRRAAPPDASR
jgi:signal peptidase II